MFVVFLIFLLNHGQNLHSVCCISGGSQDWRLSARVIKVPLHSPYLLSYFLPMKTIISIILIKHLYLISNFNYVIVIIRNIRRAGYPTTVYRFCLWELLYNSKMLYRLVNTVCTMRMELPASRIRFLSFFLSDSISSPFLIPFIFKLTDFYAFLFLYGT